MPVIHSEFLLNDKRLRRCSDQAAMAFPFLFAAANSYGRMEVDPRLLVAKCFIALDHPPSEDDIGRFFVEYHNAFLVFIYQSPDGIWWAQFDVPRNCLPRYPFARDRASIGPPEVPYRKWRCNGKTLESKALQFFCANLRKSAHGAVAFALASESAVDSKQSTVDSLCSLSSSEEEAVDHRLSPMALVPIAEGNFSGWKAKYFEQFWITAVWRKVGKGECRKIWQRIVKSESQAQKITAHAQEFGPLELKLARAHKRSALHPATYLRQGRYEDSLDDVRASLEDAGEDADDHLEHLKATAYDPRYDE